MFAVKEIYGDITVLHGSYATEEAAKDAARAMTQSGSRLNYFVVVELDKNGKEIEEPWEW